MWCEGRTAAEIAKELGDVTRNAVIGKAHRLKLSNRVSPIQQDNKKSASPAPVIREKIVAVVAPVTIREIPLKTKGVKMIDLRDRMCRWPSGDPREANFSFCGCGSVPGLPYCPDHAKMAYQAASRSRVLQAEDFEDRNTAVDDEAKEAAG
jgi:GcrA cell cycle regulator